MVTLSLCIYYVERVKRLAPLLEELKQTRSKSAEEALTDGDTFVKDTKQLLLARNVDAGW